MTCTWCPKEATEAGQLPASAQGKKYWPSCEAHAPLLKKLKLDPISIDEIALIERREKKQQKGII